MGEYLSRRIAGGQVEQFAKCGTMDHMMYARRSELVAWAPFDAGLGTDVRSILASPSTLYRFPWPEEDGQSVDQMNDRDPFPSLNFLDAPDLAASSHRSFVQITFPGPKLAGPHPYQPGATFNLPGCPADPALRKVLAIGQPVALINPVASIYTIVGERYNTRGEARTVFACAWCGGMFSIGAGPDFDALRDRFRLSDDERMQKIADRLHAAPAAALAVA